MHLLTFIQKLMVINVGCLKGVKKKEREDISHAKQPPITETETKADFKNGFERAQRLTGASGKHAFE